MRPSSIRARIEIVPASSRRRIRRVLHGCIDTASYLPRILSKSPDASASGLERRACPQKCKYQPANQSDWSHSLECSSFTDAIYRCRKVRQRSWIVALFVRAYMHSYVHSCVCTGICVHAGRFEKGIASFSGIANRSITKVNDEIDSLVMCYVTFDGLSDKRRKL